MPTYIVTFMDLYVGRERQKETEALSPAEAIKNVRARIASKERKIPVRRLEPELYYRFRAELAPPPPPPAPMDPPPGPRPAPPPEPMLFNPPRRGPVTTKVGSMTVETWYARDTGMNIWVTLLWDAREIQIGEAAYSPSRDEALETDHAEKVEEARKIQGLAAENPRRCSNPSGMPLEVNSGKTVYDDCGTGAGDMTRNPEEEEVGRAWAARHGLNIVVKPPASCSHQELQGFKQMVLREWQVSDEGLDRRIAHCRTLVIIYSPEGQMVGIGAAKRPQESYAKRVFEKAGVQGWDQYDYEVGYFYILPEYRERLLSRVIMESLIDTCGDVSIFATTRTDNERMIRTNKRLGFTQAGQPFRSERGDWDIYLWVRQVQGTWDGLGFRPSEWEERER